MKPKIHRIFRTLDNKTYGITVAYTTYPEDGAYLCGFGFCDPRDQHDRKLGNTIAVGRYNSTPIWVGGHLDIAEGKFDNLENAVMNYFKNYIKSTTESSRISIEKTSKFPRWMKEMVTAWVLGNNKRIRKG